MSTTTEEPQVQTINGKEHEAAVKEAQKNGSKRTTVGCKDGQGHYDVEEEVQLYALENAFSWPVSLVMSLNHKDHPHHSHATCTGEKHEEKEVQYAVENAFSWPVSFVMHVIHENLGHRRAKHENEKKANGGGECGERKNIPS